jgi:predicted RNA-binding Zn-ribbon protein involved in translation (DUF1610 family)
MWCIKEYEPFNDDDPNSFSGEVKPCLFNKRDPETGELTSDTELVRPSNFNWVYYHEENKQHGEIDAQAVEFIMDKITRTLSGELPRTPTETHPHQPSLNSYVIPSRMICEICGAIQPMPFCADCNQFMNYDESKDKFVCPSCGKEVPWPTHCGQRMTIYPP